MKRPELVFWPLFSPKVSVAAWIPTPAVGTHLDDNILRITIAQRVGAPECHQRKCKCEGQMDSLGHHSLAWKLSA